MLSNFEDETDFDKQIKKIINFKKLSLKKILLYSV